MLRDYDAAFPVLIKNLLPTGIGLKGFVLAAIFGAVVSSLASMLNSSSTIFTMDVYRKINKEPSQFQLVSVGRICVVVFVFIAMLIAPDWTTPNSAASSRSSRNSRDSSPREFWRSSSSACWSTTRREPAERWVSSSIRFFTATIILRTEHRLSQPHGNLFLVILAVLTIMTLLRPLPAPVPLPVNESMDMRTDDRTKVFDIVAIVLTLTLYAIFW